MSHKSAQTGIAICRSIEISGQIVIGFRGRQFKGQNAQRNIDRFSGFAVDDHIDFPLIQSFRINGRIHCDPNLFPGIGIQTEGLECGRIGDPVFPGVQRDIDLNIIADPNIFCFAFRSGDPQIIFFYGIIGFDQCFIVQQQLRGKRSAGAVCKIAVPTGSRQIPDLHDLQIKCRGGNGFAIGSFQVRSLEHDLIDCFF